MTAATASVKLTAPSLRARLWGLGSVYGKTIRDSRRAVILVSALLGVTFLGVSKAIVTEFNTPESRQEMVDLINAVPPILQGLAGPIVNVGTLGGYLAYKYGTFFPLIVSLWSILALSGTLASEARRGSLDFVAAAPLSKARVALEKLSGHLTGLFIASLVTFVSIAIAGQAFAVLPGDEISVTSAFGYALWMVLMALAGGSLAFALAQFVGRGAGAGIAGFVTIAGFIVNGYQAPVPELGPIANLTWFGWTVNHVPLAGQFDWPSVAFLAVFDVILLAIGVWAFVRRDLGATSSVPTPSLPRALVGLRGPLSRTIGINLPAAIAWGLGIGVFGLVLAASGSGFIDQLHKSEAFMNLLNTAFPGIDFATVGGFLQLLFIELGIVLGGLAAVTLVGGWASEETSGRLEMVLSAPLSRLRWALSGGTALFVCMALVIALVGLGIGIGGASTGGDLLTPILGASVLAFYGWALIGIGVAVGGLVATRFSAAVVALVVFLTWFLQLLGPLFNLPDWIQNLALTKHLGQTMVGVWDWGGVALCVGIGVVGVALGAWGFTRRDLRA
jgi:polyether ionophore transport system permease protein